MSQSRFVHILVLCLSGVALAHGVHEPPVKRDQPDKFEQLGHLLPTPNTVRNGAGAPGPDYWQQQVDYRIDVEIDDERQHLIGSEQITYQNNSPDTLTYLWLQIDHNLFAADSDTRLTGTAPNLDDASMWRLRRLLEQRRFDGTVAITSVKDAAGNDLSHAIVKTMMRVDLPAPLAPGQSFEFSVDWNYPINDCRKVGGRGGYEYFEDDDNYLYVIAQWFPRLCAYTDLDGWQNKQFLGRGEFALEFGDYQVNITMPAEHVVTATGVLQNPEECLTEEQRDRLAQAAEAAEPMFVITEDEARVNEGRKVSGEKKTWVFHAENVRDFAFASSRKFLWDAMKQEVEGNRVLCMSFYPKEGEPLWSRYSTWSVAHAVDVYSRHCFPYPYPVAISVHGPVGGMEYPMICFNGPRPEKDGTYSKRTKYGLISVVIHEVGHNWFPMIVNSDERQWTWMDEGLNTFVQYLAECSWEEKYPSRRGEPRNMINYMTSTDQVPIMTNSESILQFGNNAYGKPATALNVLRETVLGRELFDFAFAEYSRRWMFKRPAPGDLFRTLEDASGIDLDWFWRGWFYSVDHTDIAITNLRLYRMDDGDPDAQAARAKAERESRRPTLAEIRNQDLKRLVEEHHALVDFYNTYDELDTTDRERKQFAEFLERLEPEEREILESQLYFYVVDLENLGGLVMPVILELHMEDGSVDEIRIPAEIWRRDCERVSKLLLTEQRLDRIVLDPHAETADADTANNHWPRRTEEQHFHPSVGNPWGGGGKNPMQLAREAAKRAEEERKKAEEGK